MFISFIGFSQKTEKAYIQYVKYQYVKGDFNTAKDYLENALEKYPNSKELFKLKALVEEDGGIVVEPPQPPRPQPPRPQPPRPQPPRPQPPRPEPPRPQPPRPQPPTKPKPITISVDLAMISQNNFTWNSKVAEEGLKATLVFQTNSGAEFRKDVTGLSSFKFKSGDTRFDGVMTNVELLITTKEGVKVTGTTKIKTRTTC